MNEDTEELLAKALKQLALDNTRELADIEAKYDILFSKREFQSGSHLETWINNLAAYFCTMVRREQYNKLIKVCEKLNIENDTVFPKDHIVPCCILYSYYKMNRTRKFLEWWKRVGGSLEWIHNSSALSDNRRHMLHIFAQFCFRNGQYENAYEIYSYLAEHGNEVDNPTEILCNKTAQLTNLQNIVPDVNFETDSCDLLLNQSMVLVSRRQYDLAAKYLEKALSIAITDSTNEDVRYIKLELAYVYQMLGNKDESKNLLRSLLSGEKSDPVSVLAKTNIKSFEDLSKYKSNFALILRELDQKRLFMLANKSLSKEQSSIIFSNVHLLKLFGNQEIKKSKTKLSSVFHFYSSCVDNVAFEEYKTQAKLLKNNLDDRLTEGNAESLLGETLLCISLQIHEKNIERAISIAEKYWNLLNVSELTRSKKAMTYIMVQLYEQANRSSSLCRLLNKLFSMLDVSLVKEDCSFWKFVAFKFLSLGQSEPAITILEHYAKFTPVDQSVSYVFGTTDIDMQTVAELVQDIDVQNLIENGVKTFESRKKVSTGFSTLKKKRRVHKKKKNFTQSDNSESLDPQRWLPMKDRSYYRVSKKQISNDTQGGKISRSAVAKLDITKKSSKKNNSKNKRKK